MTGKAVRAKTQGVMAFLRVERNEVVLVLNDGAEESEGGRWRVVRLFTEKKFPREAFFDLSLDKRDYEDIGFNLVNRLISIVRPDAAPPHAGPRRRK